MYQEATAEGLPQAKPGWNGRQRAPEGLCWDCCVQVNTRRV